MTQTVKYSYMRIKRQPPRKAVVNHYDSGYASYGIGEVEFPCAHSTPHRASPSVKKGIKVNGGIWLEGGKSNNRHA